MPTDASHKIALLIKATYPLPAQVEAALSDALNDLYNGPSSSEEVMPYHEACTILRSWAEDNLPYTLYVDLDCDDVMEDEPSGHYETFDVEGDDEEIWIEPSPYYEVGAKEIWCAVFGAAIVNEGGLY